MVTLNTKTDTKANLFLLYYVSLEYQPQMVSGFLNYTSVFQTALYCWVCQMLHETSFQVINMYYIGLQNRASELL
jgi:hypothetical protein